MVVCKFFLQGNCRYGENCRNEHPRSGGFGNQNRFAPLQNNGNRFGPGNDVRKDSSNWNINVTDVQNDLTNGKNRPNWILTAYGPGRGPPASLLEGNEYSPEEVRVRFYELASNGNQVQADQEAMVLWNKADQSMNDISNNANNVLRFMEDAEKKHPNRYDFCKTDGSKTREQIMKDFTSQVTRQSSPAFGASNGFGQGSSASNPFGKPATATFGQPSGPSAFGSNPFGKPPPPAFGQSGFGGTSAQTTNTSNINQPNAFGKPSFGTTGFGQPAFGQTAQSSPSLGQASQSTPSFGQPTFGNSGFGSSGFGQTAPKNPFAAPLAASGNGQSSATFAQATGSSSGFGQSPQTNTGFGQSAQVTTFGQPNQTNSAFAKPSQLISAFGQPSQPTSVFGQSNQSTAFGKPAFTQSGQPGTVFGQPPQSGTPPFGQSGVANPFGSTNTTQAFGSASGVTGNFGQNATARQSPFAATPATMEPNDQAMETASSHEPRPTSRGTPFGAPTLNFGMSDISVPEQKSSALSLTSQANTNTSSTQHTLTGKPPKPLYYTQTLPPQPSQTNMSKQLVSYRGRRVQYLKGVPCYERPDRRGWEKIWFPDGSLTTDVVALNKPEKLEDVQAPEDQYTDIVKEAYRFLLEEGRFKNGKIPLVPPMHKWCEYDF